MAASGPARAEAARTADGGRKAAAVAEAKASKVAVGVGAKVSKVVAGVGERVSKVAAGDVGIVDGVAASEAEVGVGEAAVEKEAAVKEEAAARPPQRPQTGHGVKDVGVVGAPRRWPADTKTKNRDRFLKQYTLYQAPYTNIALSEDRTWWRARGRGER
jgi:hypothetical protein